jgi:hypothetical protein
MGGRTIEAGDEPTTLSFQRIRIRGLAKYENLENARSGWTMFKGASVVFMEADCDRALKCVDAEDDDRLVASEQVTYTAT